VSTDPYQKRERSIAASDSGTIVERWAYGRELLADSKRTTPAGNLRHGSLAYLIGRAARAGCKVGEREIQRRLQAAKTYKTEAEIRQALTDFRTWGELLNAGFPPVDAPAEIGRAAADSDSGPGEPEEHPAGPGEQMSLFPEERFGRLATLADLAKYDAEQIQYTANMAARDEKAARLPPAPRRRRGRRHGRDLGAGRAGIGGVGMRAAPRCWCHAQYGLAQPADDRDGLCSSCRNRSPSACKNAHEKAGGADARWPPAAAQAARRAVAP